MYPSSRLLRKWHNNHRKYLYFALIEIIVVAAIIAVLAALLIPQLLNAKCRSLLRKLLGLIDAIKADINSATSTGPATEQAFRNILTKMKDAADLFKDVKKAGCIKKEDKKTINKKIDETIALLTQVKSSQNEEVQQMIDQLFERLREERYPNNETE